MTWLRTLRAARPLVACGGSGFENHGGGLPLVRANDSEAAAGVAAPHPLHDIGETGVLVWDVDYGALDVPRDG